MNNEVVSTLGNRASAHPATAAVAARGSRPLLEIKDLNVQFVTSHGTLRAVEDLSYSVHAGEIVAIVGESGSGKSVSALAIMQLLPPGKAVDAAMQSPATGGRSANPVPTTGVRATANTAEVCCPL